MSFKDFKEQFVAYVKVNTMWQEFHEHLNYTVQYIVWYLNVEPTRLFHIQERVVPILTHFFYNSAFIFIFFCINEYIGITKNLNEPIESASQEIPIRDCVHPHESTLYLVL